LKRKTPFGALPTAVLYAFTIYAVFIYYCIKIGVLRIKTYQSLFYIFF
jgi:hypothetical protein